MEYHRPTKDHTHSREIDLNKIYNPLSILFFIKSGTVIDTKRGLRMVMKRISPLICVSLILLGSLLIDANGGSLGVAPPYINIDDAARGAKYQRTIIIYNQEEYDVTVLLNSTGEIKDWISFYENSNMNRSVREITINATSRRNVLILISIPEDASNRRYEGMAVVSSLPRETNLSRNSTYVSLNIPILMSINVTGEQVLNVSILSININDVEVGSPLEVRIQFKNTGNVVATPCTNITFTKDNIYIDRVESLSDPIQPGSLYTQILYLNTTGKPAGKYVAHIKVYLDGKIVEEREVYFDLLPEGTFTRSGELIDFGYEGKIEKGRVIKIYAIFKNTGKIDTSAKLIAEVYRNGELADALESDEIIVPKYKQEELSVYYEIPGDGSYSIKGYIIYGGKKTATSELKFKIGENWIDLGGAYSVAIGISLLSLVSVVTPYILWKKGYLRRLSKKK